jgi:exodeoxyribonuclease VII large subunit
MVESNSQSRGSPVFETGVQIFSVKDLSEFIKNKLTCDDALSDIWVQGEISNFKSHSSGHFYFTLKDEDSQVPCAMFRWANQNLEFDIKDGMKVIVRGNIDVYIPQGRYNLVVSEVHPKGIGELYLKYLQLKENLAKEGLFDVAHKQVLPRFPKKVGLVTSQTGAAVKDMINIIKRRFPSTDIILAPTLVQGERAKEEIVHSIKLLNEIGGIDVIIIGRGGGSIEDLWPFNEEIVARAVFDSKVPIISAVGHETDFTISDFVADIRAATPSAAAEIVVPDKEDVLQRIGMLHGNLRNVINTKIELLRTRIEDTKASLRIRLVLEKIIQYQQRVDEMETWLESHMIHIIEINKGQFEVLTGKLESVSPLATLGRGYTIAQKLPEKTVVDTIEKVDIDDDLSLIVKNGRINCKVFEKTEDLEWNRK